MNTQRYARLLDGHVVQVDDFTSGAGYIEGEAVGFAGCSLDEPCYEVRGTVDRHDPELGTYPVAWVRVAEAFVSEWWSPKQFASASARGFH